MVIPPAILSRPFLNIMIAESISWIVSKNM
jgi:hypothetical protein